MLLSTRLLLSARLLLSTRLLLSASLVCTRLVVATSVTAPRLRLRATPVAAGASLSVLHRRLRVLILPAVPIVLSPLRLRSRRNEQQRRRRGECKCVFHTPPNVL